MDDPAWHGFCKCASPGGGAESIPKILSLVHDLSVCKLHDGDGVAWDAVIRDEAFTHPRIIAASDPPYLEMPIGRVPASLRRNRLASAETFT